MIQEQGRLSRQWLQGMLESMETVDAMDEAVHQLVATEKGALVEVGIGTHTHTQTHKHNPHIICICTCTHMHMF